MTYFGFDHHKRWTQAVAMDEQGRVLPKPWKGVVEAGPTCHLRGQVLNLRVQMKSCRGP